MAKSQKRLKNLKKVLNIYTVIGVTLWIAATVLIVIPALPYLWYRIDAGATESEIASITEPTEDDADPEVSFGDLIADYNEENQNVEEPEEETIELPPFDPTLSTTNKLTISKIGVDGELQEGPDPEPLLKKGLWRVNDFGTPEDNYTMIVAAHRFGYIWWSGEFRTTNSFYNLPKTGVGDKVEIVWNQRKYEYEIYRAEDSTSIVDYEADLILYTCRMFNSPVRIFRYAKRVN